MSSMVNSSAIASSNSSGKVGRSPRFKSTLISRERDIVDDAVMESQGVVSTVQQAASLPDFVAHYLTCEESVNSALRFIVDGVVRFDTEFLERQPTSAEKIINDTMALVGGSRKSAIQAWQALELRMSPNFPLAWNTMGLCVVQIARGRDVWIIHLSLMKAFPSELRRILTSSDVSKVGVGLLSDISVVWNDLRIDLNCLVDVGMMARLALAEAHTLGAYQNLSMDVCAREVLSCEVDKTQQVSNWRQRLTQQQIQYAGTDAMVSLRLYEVLLPRLHLQALQLRREISPAWYCFNSRLGEAIRTKRTIRNEVVPWSTKDCPWFFAGKFQGYYP
ncbi:ribonuclease H-like domain-containing protein [Mycena epipterygia]|nr:ribonuclease H-like domain-containing protein [Mycena epipterygia]